MAITTNCSGCGKTLAVADEFAGRQARCPACGQIYTVPSPVNLTPVLPTVTPNGLDATVGYPNSTSVDLGAASTPTTPISSSAYPSNAGQASFSAGSSAGGSSSAGIQYWMKAGNGVEYGPADAATLSRWFSEGRVGADYQIRIGQHGHWQPAALFQASFTGSTAMPSTGANPYATPSNFSPGMASARVYPKADQSGLVLAMGILAWIGGCPIFGIIAWVVGGQALGDINAGLADPSSRGVIQVGYYLGMINVIVCVACGGLFLLGLVLSAM